MSYQRSPKRLFMESTPVVNSLKECNSTPYKRRKQTSQALEALGKLFADSSVDDLDNNKLNKNDILSLTLSRLLRRKYWSSNTCDRNIQLAADIRSQSTVDELKGFIAVLNTSGRIIFLSDNVEYYLRKNVRSLYPQLISIYDCVSASDHDAIRQMLSTPTTEEKHAICSWILPRGKRPNRSNAETKPMLLTGHFLFVENEGCKEPLFVARCEQMLSSTPNAPTNTAGCISTNILRFILTDQMQISEVSSNAQSILGYKADELTDQSIHRIVPTESWGVVEEARQNCLTGQYCTSMCVMDLYTANGDRLSFLCNTHMIIEGRRKRVKLGFLAQLIDPSIRYQCISYANKQNAERRKAFLQQESNNLSNVILNNSMATNVAMSPNDQCLSMKDSPKYKRQRTSYEYTEKENCSYFDVPQSSAQVPLENNSNVSYVPAGKQELGHIDELFHWLEEENNKPRDKFSMYDPIHDIFSMDHMHDFGLFATSLSDINFF